MAEYVMGPDDTQEEVSRSLIDHAGPERAHEIAWYPRPGVPGGGVFWMPDDLADGYTSDRVFRLDDGAHPDANDGDAATTTTTSSRSRRQAAKANKSAESDTDNKE